MMNVTALCHSEFVKLLTLYIETGVTQNERDLARMALDLYQLVPTHPLIAHYVDQFALRATA